MDTKKETGGAAFPNVFEIQAKDGYHRSYYVETGMDLRDYFAAKALAGMTGQFHEHWTTASAAKAAYELADAMLAERAK